MTGIIKPVRAAATALVAFVLVCPPVLAGQGQDWSEQILESVRLRDSGKPADAAALLEPLVTECPEDALLIAALADALDDMDKQDRALRLYEKAVQIDPGNVDYRIRLAELLLASNQRDSALEQYMVIVESRPFDPVIRKRTADLLVEADRTDVAIPHLQAYLQAVPNDDAALRILYNLYLWNDRTDDAVRTLKVLVDRNPDDIALLRLLAERYLDAGQEKEAIGAYSRVVEKDRQDAASLRTLGNLYEWNARPREALASYERYLALRPFDSEVRLSALMLSSDLGLGRKARLHAQLVRAGDPRYADLAKDIVVADTGFGSYVALDYTLYQERERFMYHQVGPRVSVGVTDWASVGAYYNFRYHQDISTSRTKAIMAHQFGAFATLSLPEGVMIELDGSYAYYTNGWHSGNAGFTVSKDFDSATLTFVTERRDVLTSLGDIEDSVVATNATLAVYATPWDRMLISAEAFGGIYDDHNSHFGGSVGLGVRLLRSPELELMYNYTIDHYTFTSKANSLSYFAPDLYHVHGPELKFTHPVNHWFTYTLLAGVWHAYGYGDNALMFTGMAEFVFRPAAHHLIRTSYQGNVEMWGSVQGNYQDNLFLFRYAYEF